MSDPQPAPLSYYSGPQGDFVPVWRKATVIGLAVAGVLVYVAATVNLRTHRWHEMRTAVRPVMLIAMLALLLLAPTIHRPIARWLDGLRNLSRGGRRLLTLFVWLVASLYLAYTAHRQGRDFSFKTQDEFMYLVQVQALAHGHLWMPQHPMADFFQEFYVFVRPVTSSMYFPGASLMFVPAVWFHIPFAAIALFICGGVVAMTYRVTAELIDSIAGLLAALLMVAQTTFRTLSLQTLSYMPMALLGLLLIWAYLHWRQKRCYGWAAVIGVIAGWSAITRPLDAIVFFVPILALMVYDALSAERRRPWEVPIAWLIMTIAAAPFLSMQLALDKAVTGHIGKTPVQEYHDQFWPGTVGGMRPHLEPGRHRPSTSLPQFQANYDQFVLPHYRGKPRALTEVYLREMEYALPHYLLFALLPVSVMGLVDRRRFAVWAILPLFPTAYVTWVMFIKWYAIVVAPILMYAIVLGADAIVATFPRGRAFLLPWLTASVAAMGIVHLPELYGPDKPTGSAVMSAFNQAAATQIQKPALVFFRYHPEIAGLWKGEQTYNAEAAWFDDEQIIRAHDLGSRDIELIRYYADRQPGRTVYLFDQSTMELRELGNVSELAKDSELLTERLAAPSTQPAATAPAATQPKAPARRSRKSRGA